MSNTRKKNKKNKRAIKRARDRLPPNSAPAANTSQSGTSTLFQSSLVEGNEDKKQLEQNQGLHTFDEEDDGKLQGKRVIVNDPCKNGQRSEGTIHRQREIIRPRMRNVLSRMRHQQDVVTEEALAKSRGDKAHKSWKVKQAKAALARDFEEEEHEASREPVSEDANIYNLPLSPTSRHEIPLIENATVSENLMPMPERTKSRRRKRKRKADLGGSQKRLKLASEPSSVQKDNSTVEESTVVHKDKKSHLEAQRGNQSRNMRTSPMVEIITKGSSKTSLQRARRLASIPVSLPSSARSDTPGKESAIGEASQLVSKIRDPVTPLAVVHPALPNVGAIVEKVDALEDRADCLGTESTPLKLDNSLGDVRCGLKGREPGKDRSISHECVQTPATPDYDGLTIERPSSVKGSGGLLRQDWVLAIPSEQSVLQTYQGLSNSPTSHDSYNSTRRGVRDGTNIAQQDSTPIHHREVTPNKPLKTKANFIILDSGSEDDIEITSVTIAPAILKGSQYGPSISSPRKSLSSKPCQPSNSSSVFLQHVKTMSKSLATTPSQARKKGPPGLKELPTAPQFTPTVGGSILNVKLGENSINRKDVAGLNSPGLQDSLLEIEASLSTEEDGAPRSLVASQNQAGNSQDKGPSGLKPSHSTDHFTPALVRRLIRTKPGPISVREDEDEGLTSPESSPGPGIARLQIKVGPKQTKFVREKPLPIAISSGEDSEEDSPIKSRKRTINRRHLQHRDGMSRGATTASHPASQNANLQRSSCTLENVSRSVVEQQEIWPEGFRGPLAQAAIAYLNAIPQNKQAQMDAAEMLSLLGEQPEFDELCLKVKSSGRTFAKPAFARAILSQLESEAVKDPVGDMFVNRTQSSSVQVSTSIEHVPLMSKTKTTGQVMDKSLGNTLSRHLADPATKPQSPDGIPRNDVTRAPLRDREDISLMSPAPISSPEYSFSHVSKRRRTTELTRNGNTTSYVASSQVIVLDSPDPASSTDSRLDPDQVAQRKTRKNETLDHIAERHTTEQSLSESVRQPELSVYNRIADRLGRTEEVSRKSTTSTSKSSWNHSQDNESMAKVRGRSTSVSLHSEQITPTQLDCQTFQLTPRKIRGRSTTPELWIVPHRITMAATDGTEKVERQNDDGESMDSSDDFFDAKERLPNEAA